MKCKILSSNNEQFVEDHKVLFYEEMKNLM